MGSRSRTNGEFLAGDGLRAVAALSVLVFHAVELVVRDQFGNNYTAAFGDTPGRIAMSLNDGLYIFFVLSGYLLSRGFARSIVEGRQRPSIRRYGVNRLLRILPAFWLVITITLLLRGTDGAGIGQIAALYGFAQVYSVHLVNTEIIQAWTLDIEMGFYILMPILFILATRFARRQATPTRRAWALLVPLAAVALASYALDVHDQPSTLNATPPEFFFAFVPGMALAIVEPLVDGALPALRTRLLIPAMLTLAAILYAGTCALPRFSMDRRAAIAAIASGLLVGAALVRQWSTGTSWRALDNRPMRWLGERSYGIYLFHWLVMLEVASLATQGRVKAVVLVTGATLILSIAAAALSWRFVEQPALRLRRRSSAARPAAAPVREPQALTATRPV